MTEKQASGKKLSKKSIVWIVVGAVVLLAIIIAVAGGGSNSSKTSSESTPASSVATEAWQVVFTLSGADNATSEYFDIIDANTKITYNVESDPILGVIYLEPDSKVDLDAEGAFPVVTITEAGEESEVVTGKPAGKYWLDVRIPGNWTVTVEQYK